MDPTPWHALYELLPQKEVVVPYAPAIARLLEAQDLPEDLTRLRRDFGRFLTLVKVVALLHHARREEREGRLVAALEDYALAYHLAARPMARSVHTVSPQALALAVAVREVHEAKVEEAAGKNIPEGSVAVYVKDLARHLRWAKRTVQKWVDQAEAAGLVDVQRDGNRLAIRPVEGAPLEEAAFRLLPEPERLARELGEGGSYVHPLTGETCVLFLPQTACAFPSKTEENALQYEENQRARHAHDRARPPRNALLERKNPVRVRKWLPHRKDRKNAHAPWRRWPKGLGGASFASPPPAPGPRKTRWRWSCEPMAEAHHPGPGLGRQGARHAPAQAPGGGRWPGALLGPGPPLGGGPGGPRRLARAERPEHSGLAGGAAGLPGGGLAGSEGGGASGALGRKPAPA